MSKFGLAQPVRRVEDPRLLKGEGRYTDDITVSGTAAWRGAAEPARGGADPVDRHRRGEGRAGRARGVSPARS